MWRAIARTSSCVVLLLGLVSRAPAQSLPLPETSSSQPEAQSPATLPTPEETISGKQLFINIAKDQKPIWLFPVRAAQGKHWKPALAFVVGTAALVALDPHDTPYFRRTSSFVDFNKVFSGRNTLVGTAIFPISLYIAGLARKDSYAQNTALLAGEAVANAQLLTLVMKNVDRRLRPSVVPPNGDFAHTWFKAKTSFISGGQSFPSGHAITAFSIATVFADRYRRHRWVQWVAYSLAGVVGCSRVTLQAHFPSDVVAGAILGFVISRDVVLRPR